MAGALRLERRCHENHRIDGLWPGNDCCTQAEQPSGRHRPPIGFVPVGTLLLSRRKPRRISLSMTREDALNIFLSYAPEDEALHRQLDKHLALLQRQREIHTWHRGKILAGSEIAPELSRQLETADVVLLLISTDFIASDFCWCRQMTRA